MKKVIILSALAFGTLSTFAQSQNTKAAAPVTNLTANAVSVPASSAPVQQKVSNASNSNVNQVAAEPQKKNTVNNKANKSASSTNNTAEKGRPASTR